MIADGTYKEYIYAEDNNLFLVKSHVKMTGLGHFQGLISDVTQKLMKNTARVENLYWMLSINMKKMGCSGPITLLDLTFITVGSL